MSAGRAYNALVKRVDADIRTVADLCRLNNTALQVCRYLG